MLSLEQKLRLQEQIATEAAVFKQDMSAIYFMSKVFSAFVNTLESGTHRILNTDSQVQRRAFSDVESVLHGARSQLKTLTILDEIMDQIKTNDQFMATAYQYWLMNKTQKY